MPILCFKKPPNGLTQAAMSSLIRSPSVTDKRVKNALTDGLRTRGRMSTPTQRCAWREAKPEAIQEDDRGRAAHRVAHSQTRATWSVDCLGEEALARKPNLVFKNWSPRAGSSRNRCQDISRNWVKHQPNTFCRASAEFA